ncbi:MAG: AlpA family transcriptional regulator [Gallionella sp.]|nr:AlpA family transcriptional regulator [Gallionella sp.]
MNKHDYNCQEAAHSCETGTANQQQTADYLLPRKTVEKLSGLSRATIYRLIKSGKFPRPLSIGTGSVRWRQSDVIAWQQSLSPSSSK